MKLNARMSYKSFFKKVLVACLIMLLSVNLLSINVSAQETETDLLIPISNEEYNEIVAELEDNELELANKPSNYMSEEPLDNFVKNGSLLDVNQNLNVENLTFNGNVVGIEKTEESDIMPLSEVPVANMIPYINNPESLRDGMITTATEIIWVYAHSDADGDITTTYYGGFPLDYVIADEEGVGFATKIYTPGTYSVLCQAEDAEGNLSQVIGYTVTVVPEEDFQTIEGNLDSETDVKTYNVDIDFSEMSSAAICVVKMGDSDIDVKVYDSDNNLVITRGTQYQNPKNWYYLNKPSADAMVCSYRLEVFTNNFNTASSDFRVLIGNKENAEYMMGGLENVISLETYYESKGNFISNLYSPSADECWFKFTMMSPTTITLLNHNSNIKYKIKETTNLFDVYNSVNDENSYRNKFTGSSYSSAEKVKFNTNAGQEFYLVVYNAGTSGSGSLNENNFLLGVGKPVMMGSHVSVYGSSMTAGSTSFSGTQYFELNTSNIPTTAQVANVSLSGVTLSKIDKWRLLSPGSSSWKQSSTRGSSISYTYMDDSNFNTLMYGTWGFSLKADSSTLTFMPRLSFTYYYEMGD